jgi:hypothetical protein
MKTQYFLCNYFTGHWHVLNGLLCMAGTDSDSGLDSDPVLFKKLSDPTSKIADTFAESDK